MNLPKGRGMRASEQAMAASDTPLYRARNEIINLQYRIDALPRFQGKVKLQRELKRILTRSYLQP